MPSYGLGHYQNDSYIYNIHGGYKAIYMKYHFQTVRCAYAGPLGPMTLAAHDVALVGVWFDGQKHQPDFSDWALAPHCPVLRTAVLQLQQYFAGDRQAFNVPLDLTGGTEFQQKVWEALLDIDPGTTVSYGTISQRIGKPAAVRAVGSAIGHNPLSIVVPCHRVVGADGALTGYAGGLERKIALLNLETLAT
jgi:methylated-DNA-[protein]-cysteine S-methyltransferase